MQNDRLVSPDGRYEMTVIVSTGLMSHIIETPLLRDARSGEVLLEFRDSRWSVDPPQWLSDSTIRMQLRKYPGSYEPDSLIVDVDCSTRTATIGDQHLASLSDVETTLDSLLRPRAYVAPKKRGLLNRLARKVFG